MKVLFDHNVPRKLRHSLADHQVRTAEEMHWHELENGKLIAAVETAGFDVMVTCDKICPTNRILPADPSPWSSSS